MYVPFITPTVPPATPGPYKTTGYATVHAQSKRRHTLQYPQRKDGTPVMDLTGVTFSAYYPSNERRSKSKSKESVRWAPSPTDAVVDGYEAYFDLPGPMGWLFFCMKLIVGRFKIPLIPNAPVAPVHADDQRYPILILSHGLAGTRNTYSQYCQALASQGYVVLAIEHRDGSGPMYVVPDQDGNRNVVNYAPFKDLKWAPGEEPKDPMRLRGLQLDFRVREVYEVYEVLKEIAAGTADAMVDGMMVEQERTFFSQLRDTLNLDNVNVGGHSMGGGTTFRLLQTAPPDGYEAMPVKHAISLDPWLPPFEFADERPKNKGPFPPSLSINSQEYTEWEPHFSQVVEASKAMGASFVTVPGMTHESFSDSQVICSMSIAGAQRRLATCHALTMSLFNDALEDCEFVKDFDVDGGKPAKKGGKLIAQDEVVVHLL